MKSLRENMHHQKTMLWVLLFSFVGLVIVVSVQMLVSSGNDDVNRIQTLSQPEVVAVPDSVVTPENGGKKASEQENKIGSENRLAAKGDATEKNITELGVDPVARIKNEIPERKAVSTADKIPDNQSIAQLISANVEVRKRKVAALIKGGKGLAVVQKTSLNHIQLELNKAPAGEQRDNLIKEQKQLKLELAATEKTLLGREALLNRLNSKAIEYSQSQF